MKKAIVFLFCLSIFPLPTYSAQSGRLGIGVIAGEPFGPTMKYWLNEKAAVDFGFGFNGDGIIYTDYLWHGWELPTRQDAGTAGLYTGIGARFEYETHDDDKYAARVPFGINFLLNRHPIEFFGELVPVLQFSPDGDLDLDAGIGVRVYFAGIR